MDTTFSDLNLNASLLRAIEESGYTKPTPVQEKSIPKAMEGNDLAVCAQTGSGKTAAFLLPSIHRISLQRSELPGMGPRILVLTPTRELAQQVENNVKILAKHTKWLKSLTLVGGSSYRFQSRILSKPLDIVIATPGRLIDMMKQRKIQLNRLEILILDEADRMLDMGFIDDIKSIINQTPSERQTLLFSATLDGEIGRLSQKMMKNPENIQIERTKDHGRISEFLYYTNDFKHKIQLLDYLIRDPNIEQSIIFTSTKIMSQTLADNLSQKGHIAACLNGDMNQNHRNRTLKEFQRKKIKFLIATDVAARGIDVPTITHVINFDLPKQAEDYVHRIGRTGRAGREGIAITFSEVNEYTKIHKIEKYTERKINEVVIEGMEPTRQRSKNKPTSNSKPRRHNNNSSFKGARTKSNDAQGMNKSSDSFYGKGKKDSLQQNSHTARKKPTTAVAGKRNFSKSPRKASMPQQ